MMKSIPVERRNEWHTRKILKEEIAKRYLVEVRKQLLNSSREYRYQFPCVRWVEDGVIDVDVPRLPLSKNKYLEHRLECSLNLVADLYHFPHPEKEKRRSYIILGSYIPVLRLRIGGGFIFDYDIIIPELKAGFEEVMKSISRIDSRLPAGCGDRYAGFLRDPFNPPSREFINRLSKLIYEFYYCRPEGLLVF